MKSKKVSWLNLHEFIPVKDVRKLIYQHLDKFDRKIVKAAHNDKINKSLYMYFFDIDFAFWILRNKYFNLIPKWKDIEQFSIDLGYKAAHEGNLNILKYLKKKFPGSFDKETCAYAADHDQLKTLIWLRKNGCPWDFETARRARKNGSTELREWLIENNCPGSDMDGFELNSYDFYNPPSDSY